MTFSSLADQQAAAAWRRPGSGGGRLQPQAGATAAPAAVCACARLELDPRLGRHALFTLGLTCHWHRRGQLIPFIGGLARLLVTMETATEAV